MMTRHGSPHVDEPEITIHDLRVSPDQFVKFSRGMRAADVRHNNRKYRVGDFVSLRSYLDSAQTYTGERAYFRVADVVHGQLGIASGFVVLTFSALPPQWGYEHGDSGEFGAYGVYVGGNYADAMGSVAS